VLLAEFPKNRYYAVAIEQHRGSVGAGLTPLDAVAILLQYILTVKKW
jgi:hypothetical protein